MVSSAPRFLFKLINRAQMDSVQQYNLCCKVFNSSQYPSNDLQMTCTKQYMCSFRGCFVCFVLDFKLIWCSIFRFKYTVRLNYCRLIFRQRIIMALFTFLCKCNIMCQTRYVKISISFFYFMSSMSSLIGCKLYLF